MNSHNDRITFGLSPSELHEIATIVSTIIITATTIMICCIDAFPSRAVAIGANVRAQLFEVAMRSLHLISR